ncbi:MAG TPA: malonic semialdehyde reductase [Tepidisphaeraceae bacterium]|jgi:3-hydroxypropanoate dehydrogenase
MAKAIDQAALNAIFLEARTHGAWLPKPVDDELLRRLYDVAKLGPTSANTSPMRVVFVKSMEAKERLKPALSPGNVEKTMAAPVTAIVATDMRFHQFIPKLWPHNPEFAKSFTEPGKEQFTQTHAFRNATLQGAYLIIAARALGLDAGPMSGFDNAKVDEAFFPDVPWKSNFLINLGYGDPSKLKPRSPRLSFEDACRIV